MGSFSVFLGDMEGGGVFHVPCGLCTHMVSMAFGRGTSKETHLRRSVEIGRVDLCALSGSPFGIPHPLSVLRAQALPLSDVMAQALWPSDALASYPDGKEAHRLLLKVQACSALNSVWAESRRLLVASALAEQAQRRRRHLFGLLRHAASNTPAGLAITVGRVELARVSAVLSAASNKELFGVARALGGPVVGALVDRACAKFPCPSWLAPRTSVVVALDHRSLRAGSRLGYVTLLQGMTHALREGARFCGTLAVSNPVPRGAPVALPVVLSPSACRRALRGVDVAAAEVSAITVAIGERYAVVRAVLAQAKPVEPEHVRYVVARDFGYRNTAALAVVDLGQEHLVADARKAASLVVGLNVESAKAASKKWLEGHVAPEDAQVVEVQVWSGAGFMKRLSEIAGQIDVLRSEIDLIYNRIGHLKATVNRALGVGKDALVSTEVVGLDSTVQRAHTRLFRLLDLVGRLKARRLALYAQADGVKRSWLGFVSNQEALLAARYGAVVVVEDLDIVAPGKESPEYKGRAFNKMINAGCKGRYGRMASGKLAWMGVPQVAVPSFYTSSTDVRHGVVDKGQRRGDVFTSRVDQTVMHADVQAAAVIGLWPFLVSKSKPKTPSKVKSALKVATAQQQKEQRPLVERVAAAKTTSTCVRKPLFVPCVVQAFGKGSSVL